MNTRVINEADIIPNRAAGCRLVKGQLKNQEWVAPALKHHRDGSLYFTILDLPNGMPPSTPRNSSSVPAST